MRLKIELRHDDRNQDASVEDVEGAVEEMSRILHLPTIADFDIRAGHRASGAYVTFEEGKHAWRGVERVLERIPRQMESAGYASDVWEVEYDRYVVVGDR